MEENKDPYRLFEQYVGSDLPDSSETSRQIVDGVETRINDHSRSLSPAARKLWHEAKAAIDPTNGHSVEDSMRLFSAPLEAEVNKADDAQRELADALHSEFFEYKISPSDRAEIFHGTRSHDFDSLFEAIENARTPEATKRQTKSRDLEGPSL